MLLTKLKIISKIKILDFYFSKLYLNKVILEKHYIDISKNLVTILKLILGWIK